jgi:hypothetical protein
MHNRNGTQRCGPGPISISDGKLMLCAGWAEDSPTSHMPFRLASYHHSLVFSNAGTCCPNKQCSSSQPFFWTLRIIGSVTYRAVVL